MVVGVLNLAPNVPQAQLFTVAALRLAENLVVILLLPIPMLGLGLA